MKRHRDKIEKPGDCIRQGDVLLVAIDGVPKGAKKVRRKGRLVLAHGEVTGHAHAIHETGVHELTLDGLRYLEALANGKLVHEEHAAHDIKPGTYEIVQQCELGYGDEPRAVRD